MSKPQHQASDCASKKKAMKKLDKTMLQTQHNIYYTT